MKPSGAPETGDLVLSPYNSNVIGIIVECHGIECLVMWNNGNRSQSWFRRSELEVINESR